MLGPWRRFLRDTATPILVGATMGLVLFAAFILLAWGL